MDVIAAWVACVAAVGMGVALVVVTHRRLARPATLREMWLYSKRGTVIASRITALALSALSFVALVWAAVSVGSAPALLLPSGPVLPLVLAVGALSVSAVVTTTMTLVRYLRYDPPSDPDLSGLAPPGGE